ncbi:hypothetical protein D9M72_475070 [compost metagenome]
MERHELPGNHEDDQTHGQVRDPQPVLGQERQSEARGQAEVRVQQGFEGDGDCCGREQQRQEIEHREGCPVALATGGEDTQKKADGCLDQP